MNSSARPRSFPARLVAASALALLLGPALAGCGSSDSPGSGSPSTSPSASETAAATKVLSAAEAKSAVLVLANLGGRFEADTDVDHTSAAPGCLVAVDALTDKVEGPVNAVSDFMAVGSETGFPRVSSQVESYDSVDAAKKAVEDLRQAMAACTGVDETDTEGSATKLEVSATDDKAYPDADEELNVKAIGTVTNSGTEYPLGLWLAVMRFENNLTIISVGDLAKEAPGDVTELIKVANDRLTAIMAGSLPDDTAVAGG